MAHQFKSRLRELYLKVETSHYYEYQKWIILQISLDLSTSQKYGSVMNDPYNINILLHILSHLVY